MSRAEQWRQSLRLKRVAASRDAAHSAVIADGRTMEHSAIDNERFEAIAKSVAAMSRRRVVRTLVAGAVAAGRGLLPSKPAAAAHFGCRHVGSSCAKDRQCCSNRCRHGHCRSHNKGICTAGQDFCAQGDAGNECGYGYGGPCNCVVTTGNAPFCAENFTGCFACTRDAQCEDFLGKGSACVSGGSACGCTDPAKTMCALPCQSPT